MYQHALRENTHRLYETPSSPSFSDGRNQLVPDHSLVSWIKEYESQPESIFKYYSVENEADFLLKIAAQSPEEKLFYLQENVQRFLGEFVGKIPYSTVPYRLMPDGFDYAGMKVMDIYRKTGQMGTEREKAETKGFSAIESEYRKMAAEKKHLPFAFWISPPKIADYGFVFVMEPRPDNRISEYVLRYKEPRGSIAKSSEIFTSLTDKFVPSSTNGFLEHPVFIHDSPADHLRSVMQLTGIDEKTITRSAQFERAVKHMLSPLIGSYVRAVMAINEQGDSVGKHLATLEAKAILLMIYHQAERIREEQFSNPPENAALYGISDRRGLSDFDLQSMYLLMMQNSPKIIGGGSCPAIEKNSMLPGRPLFMSNSEMLQALVGNTSIENAFHQKNEDVLHCTCPFCNKKVDAQIKNGYIHCPECDQKAPYSC